MYIKGVNLGNWLVLEKWMSPGVFAGTDAEDEYYLPRRMSAERYQERINIHRSEYITERDFSTISGWGLNAVRIPVPYFVFGDRAPFIGCVEYLDLAFKWAEKYDLKILLDLHTVPDGQNGFDNGGICGVCKWSKNPEEVQFALSVLERLAKRYGQEKALLGIEVLNEPITKRAWEKVNVPKAYPAVDEEMAKGSGPNTMEFVQEFYLKAYEVLRKILPADKKIVFHDAFEINSWESFFQENKLEGVILDTHVYLRMAQLKDVENWQEDVQDYLKFRFKDPVEKLKNLVPVICGEWCLYNDNMENTYEPGKEKKEQADSYYRQAADMQLDAWKDGNGYFYWNYKLLLDTVKDPQMESWQSWDYGTCISQNWITSENTAAAN